MTLGGYFFLYFVSVLIALLIICFIDMGVSMEDEDNDDSNEIYTLKQAIGISIFWPIFVVFNLPKWILNTIKFFYEVIVDFIKLLFKLD